MEYTLRWFGEEFDSVKLTEIKQIPGVTGIISTLYFTEPGDIWAREDIRKMKSKIEDNGLKLCGIESLNVHDSIKAGTVERDYYISNYIQSLENIGKEGINLVCYNFMPVFDWTRTTLFKKRKDGSTVLSYDHNVIDSNDFESISKRMKTADQKFVLPGWEMSKLNDLKTLFDMYKNVTEEDLFNNLIYFLEKIMPTCEKFGIKMAIHPDDPAWSVFGLPRVINNEKTLEKLLKKVDNECNGVTFCSGSLGSDPQNDLISIIETMGSRIYFAHLRNIRHTGNKQFEESAHLSSDGSLDMYEIVMALHLSGFSGPIRPDHGRQIWGEQSIPGYGLYDRALGVSYLQGLHEAILKEEIK